jgi:hypothetical protein
MINYDLIINSLQVVTVSDLEDDAVRFAYGQQAIKSKLTVGEIMRYYRIELKSIWRTKSYYPLRRKRKRQTPN